MKLLLFLFQNKDFRSKKDNAVKPNITFLYMCSKLKLSQGYLFNSLQHVKYVLLNSYSDLNLGFNIKS